ncbi:MAG: single-stranded DNA-binding protein [Parcubacteria group bacterium]|nr:single-stranded DNA-binding protein [Parcubacteria group bacterium]
MNVNSVTLIGHVTQDPVSRTFGENKMLTKFTVATNGRSRSKEKKEVVDFHPVVTFGKLADICRDYIHKGRLVYVEGKLRTNRWQDDKNVVHARTEIYANEMLLLDKQQALASAASNDQEDADAAEAIVEIPSAVAVK